MSRHGFRTRHAFVIAAMTAALSAPLSAQANTNTTSTTTTGTGTTGSTMTDTARTTTREDHGFPWGLLGLLGLAGLLGRRKVETTVHQDTTTRAARPGDPNYRV